MQPEIVFQIFRPLLPHVVRDSGRKKHLKIKPTGQDSMDTEEEPKESLFDIFENYFEKDEEKEFVKFYCFFWSFSLPDLKVPEKLYNERIEHHKRKIKSGQGEQKAHQSLLMKLEDEFEKQKENHKQCKLL